MQSATCARCGLPAQAVISTIDGARPISRAYCHSCWSLARGDAGPVMLEGPITWGDSWEELEVWLARTLRDVRSHEYRRLVAHEVRRQSPNLPAPTPPTVADFLAEFDEPAG